MEEQHPPVYSSIILKPYLARKRRLADGDTKIQNCITRITNRKRKVIWYDIKVNICVHIYTCILLVFGRTGEHYPQDVRQGRRYQT